MNILMMTNTYLPHVGGVAKSVAAFSRQYRKMGHRVLVVAPETDAVGCDDSDEVFRVPAIQNFNGSDFSVVLPVPGLLGKIIKSFEPHIIHSHHPFLIGSTALRIAALHRLPHVFTHHTMYEQYTHYVPGDSLRMQKFAMAISTHYANLCDHVIAPSESIADVLVGRAVVQPISIVATGVQLEQFNNGDRNSFRAGNKIPQSAFVVGHVGRLAAEKNLQYLAESLSLVLQQQQQAYCLIVGNGPEAERIVEVFSRHGVQERLIMLGVATGNDLASAYCSMDVFAFSSKSETQGMVLTEAMAAGVPVVGLDAPGVREVIEHGVNGSLLADLPAAGFANEVCSYVKLPASEMQRYQQAARATARAFSLENSANKALAIYRELIAMDLKQRIGHDELWSGVLPLIQSEWQLLVGYAESAGHAVFDQADDSGETS